MCACHSSNCSYNLHSKADPELLRKSPFGHSEQISPQVLQMNVAVSSISPDV